MTDDRDAVDEIGELLSLADRPVPFPEPARSELLDRIIATAATPRTGEATLVPLVTPDPETNRPRRTWVVGVAASLVAIVAVALTLVAQRGSRTEAPAADQLLPVPMTVERACETLPALAAANGLGSSSVQIADVSLDDLDEVRQLVTHLSADQGGPVSADLIDDAIARIRLLEIAIGASDIEAAVSAMTAARASLDAALDQGC